MGGRRGGPRAHRRNPEPGTPPTFARSRRLDAGDDGGIHQLAAMSCDVGTGSTAALTFGV
jgi:hypothetical protein